MKKPQLMIILGPPASGKTGLALRLAAELSRPVLCKDDVKEALFDVLGSTDREGSRRFSEAALAAVLRMARTQLCAGSCCLIEGNFTRNHAAALREILGASQASAAQILCSAPLPELERRFAARVRHPGHLDPAVSADDLRRMAEQQSSFLDLAGGRWVYESADPAAYSALLRDLKFRRL